MEKQKNGELSRMFGYAGKFHVLTVLGCVLSGISTILSMLPFVCIWLVIRDLIQAFAAGDISLATGSAHYAWMAVVFAAASILIYFLYFFSYKIFLKNLLLLCYFSYSLFAV